MSDPPRNTRVLDAEARQTAFGTGGSVLVQVCQSCGARDLEPIIFVGYLPPVNTMPLVGARPAEQPAYPAQVLRCSRCELVQLGLIVDPRILFPPEYPYTSGTTRILRENFAELHRETHELVGLDRDDLVVDIGSNDGTLLRNFQDHGHRVRGVDPTDQGRRADAAGVPTDVVFFDRDSARSIVKREGRAKLVTAANVFAHVENVHSIVDGVLDLLLDDGVFVTESTYWLATVERLQFDTIYHEHLRYYTLGSLSNLLVRHGLEAFHAKRIPTHGGSIRVYATRAGRRESGRSVHDLLAIEQRELTPSRLGAFRDGVTRAKLAMHSLLQEVRARGDRVYGIGAPSRATTLITHFGLDEGIIDAVCEVTGSHKIGRYIPGTLIPVIDETALYADQPEYALLFSWHIAEELMPKLTANGFRGQFIIPLPKPRIVDPAASRPAVRTLP